MEIRPVTAADMDHLYDIDGTIESAQYLHLDRAGEGLEVGWTLAERPLRQKRQLPNRLGDEQRFLLRQIAGGTQEGIALAAAAEYPVALLLAQVEPAYKIVRIHDLRVDFDQRRQGLATAMIFQVVSAAREQGLRAVMAESTTDNLPAARLLLKCGFDLAGLDARRLSNHDLVKESVTLYWYAALD